MLNLKNWIADAAFKIFLKHKGYTEEQYFKLIHLQEERARKKKAKLKKEQFKKSEL